jgi:RNA polymerase sigma factor (sigma-70 family)
MTSADTCDVWNRFVSGDHIAFRNLFKLYYRSLYGYGMKLCSDSGLVEDCIQNLFVTVWERRDSLNHIESPNVYLYVSLRRNLLKAKKKHDKERSYNDEIHEGFSIIFGAEDIIIRNEEKMQQKAELQNALNKLSSQQKEVLYLHYYNGMSYGEIEEILSINRQSVRNHMYRAMQTLRIVLDLDIMRLVISLMMGFLLFMA